jgi:hypothetical protein
MTEPKDYYGEALAVAIRDGRENPELVAALMAQIAEAMEDTLAMIEDRGKLNPSGGRFVNRFYPGRSL